MVLSPELLSIVQTIKWLGAAKIDTILILTNSLQAIEIVTKKAPNNYPGKPLLKRVLSPGLLGTAPDDAK